MTFVWFLLIGLAAGWIAGQIMKGSSFGLVGNLVVGVVGAILGGWLFGQLGIGNGGLIWSLFAAVVGACLFLVILAFVAKKMVTK
ncbi:MAG: GlsB/YeaQ/YmgE family stress response membrane protein [Phycisphaerales bacterium JB037]